MSEDMLVLRFVKNIYKRETRSRLPLRSSNSMTKRRTHWSLNTRCGRLPSNIARKPKITSGPSFFKELTSVLSLMA